MDVSAVLFSDLPPILVFAFFFYLFPFHFKFATIVPKKENSYFLNSFPLIFFNEDHLIENYILELFPTFLMIFSYFAQKQLHH